MRKLMLAALVAAVSACSTPYQPEGLGGGYTDTPLAQDTYQVDVRGNGYTSADKVRKIGLVRAADITLTHGYSKFIILGADSETDHKFGGMLPGTYNATTYGSAYGVGNTAYGSATTTGYYTPPTPIIITNERARFVIKLIKDDAPEASNALDAHGIIAQYGADVGYGR